MTVEGLLGLALVAFLSVLILGLGVWIRQTRHPPALREVDTFRNLPQKVGEAVEGGKGIHISLGTGVVGSQATAAVLAGLTVLETVAEAATISDNPPVATTGHGASALLAQDALRRAYRRQNVIERYDHWAGRVAGPTVWSYTAGVMTTMKDEATSVSLLIGTFGNELVLMADAAWGEGAHQIIGTDDPQAQALAYVSADHPLIGEDVFASGAYLVGGRAFHRASLHAQDALRVLVVLAILGGAALKLLELL